MYTEGKKIISSITIPFVTHNNINFNIHLKFFARNIHVTPPVMVLFRHNTHAYLQILL